MFQLFFLPQIEMSTNKTCLERTGILLFEDILYIYKWCISILMVVYQRLSQTMDWKPSIYVIKSKMHSSLRTSRRSYQGDQQVQKEIGSNEPTVKDMNHQIISCMLYVYKTYLYNLMYAVCIQTHIHIIYIYRHLVVYIYIYNMPCISILCKVCRACFLTSRSSPNQPLVPWLPSRDMSWVSRAFPWNEKSVSRNSWRPRPMVVHLHHGPVERLHHSESRWRATGEKVAIC